MKSWLSMLAVGLMPALCLSAGFRASNPAVRNPVGTGRTPVSSYSNGLVTTPAPIDVTADLSVTGNLRDGKHFRGNVPYRSALDVGLDPATSSINSHRGAPSLSSFLRDTAGPEDFGRRHSIGFGARPYYSSSEAAARTVPGGPGVFAPQGTGRSFGVGREEHSAPTNFFALESAPGRRALSERGAAPTAEPFQRLQTRDQSLSESLLPSDGTFIRGISLGLQDVERLTPGEAVAARRQGDTLTFERLRDQSAQPLFDLRRDSRIANRGDPHVDGQSGPKTAGPSTSAATLTDSAVGRRNLLSTDTFRASAESSSRKKSARPDSRPPEAAPAVPTLAKGDGLVALESGNDGATPGQIRQEQTAVGSGATARQEHNAALARIRRQIDALSKSVERRLQPRPDSVSPAGVTRPSDEIPLVGSQARSAAPSPGQSSGIRFGDSSYRLKAYPPREREVLTPAVPENMLGPAFKTGNSRFESPSSETLEAIQKLRLPGRIGEISGTEISAEARRVMGAHKTPDSFAADRFGQHMRVAEDHLRTGRYYKAADSFALASVYGPDDPRALVGRSHALFAAGEYISSALFLSRALAAKPEQAKVTIDFVKLLGGPNQLARRMADIEKWFARSGSGELQLLLGYVYYQTDRLDEAKRAIDAARAKMPEASAVDALTAAVNYALIDR